MPTQFRSPNLFPTLSEAQRWLEQARETPEGALCPCCDKFDKVYNRRLTISGIRSLVALYRYSRRHGPGPHHWRDFVRHTQGEFTRLKHIGLIDTGSRIPPHKKTSGCWAITEIGRAFVEQRMAIPERMLLRSDELLGTTGPDHYIDHYWPGFDYRELMSA